MVGMVWAGTAGQPAVGVVAYLPPGATLHACLSGVVRADYPSVLPLHAGAELTATIGHVPGGWGLLESLFSGIFPGQKVVAALAVYRIVYFLSPVLLALAVCAVDEGLRRLHMPVQGLAGRA